MNRPPLFSSQMLTLILIGAAVVVAAISLLQLTSPDEAPAPSLSANGTAELNRAADRLAEPGLYAAPRVPYSRLSGEEFQALKPSVVDARLPLRIAVLPQSITRDGRIDADRLATLLHRKVGKPGVYAVLLDDRGVATWGGAYWPTKADASDGDAVADIDEAVAAAIEDATDCCSQEYADGIEEFVDRSMQTPNRALSLLFWLALFVAAVAAVWWRWLRKEGAATDETDEDALDDDGVDAVTTVLRDEVSELAYRVAALPQSSGDGGSTTAVGATGTTQSATRTAKARQLLKSADARTIQLAGTRHRSMADVAAAVRALADLRFELYALDALHQGVSTVARTAPCFIDPRHGPSEASAQFAPTGLPERTVSVCHHCAMEIQGGQRPAIRRLPRRVAGGASGWANYWEGDAGLAYVDGYWGDLPFPDEDFEAAQASSLTRTGSTVRQDPIVMLKQRLRTDRE